MTIEPHDPALTPGGQLSTAVVGLLVVLLLIPASALLMSLGPWFSMALGVVLVSVAVVVRAGPALRVPRTLVVTTGLAAITWGVLVLAMG